MQDQFLFTLQIFDAAIRVSIPLILASIAGLFSERSGIVDIGLEGKMLAGCFVAAALASLTGSVWIGLFCAILISVLLSMLHGFACITHRGDHIISGLAINLLVSGLTVVISIAIFQQGGFTPALGNEQRFTSITFWGAELIGKIPYLGAIYQELISGHNILVYFAFTTPFLAQFIVFKTRFGLRIRAVGENPQSVDTAGISVAFLRYRALIITGILTGIAGSYISTAQNASFIRDMTAGQGYIALAALIFGKWKPYNALFACLLFGFLDALSIRLQGFQILGFQGIPMQFVQALPYILTVILLAGFIGKAVAPKAIGQPYKKDR
jgi:simple sugar transport system permease protein